MSNCVFSGNEAVILIVITLIKMSVAAQKLSRDDWKKKKELEEARKAGTAPAEVDEEGRFAGSLSRETAL